MKAVAREGGVGVLPAAVFAGVADAREVWGVSVELAGVCLLERRIDALGLWIDELRVRAIDSISGVARARIKSYGLDALRF